MEYILNISVNRRGLTLEFFYPVQLAKNKKLSSVVFVARTVEDWMPHFYKETGERLEEER